MYSNMPLILIVHSHSLLSRLVQLRNSSYDQGEALPQAKRYKAIQTSALSNVQAKHTRKEM